MNTQNSITEIENDNLQKEASIGEMLRNKRIVKYYSIEDIAKQLRLSPNTIIALESDDYTSLPGITFVRGYIRSYAKLLEIAEESVMARFQSISASEPEPALPPVTLFKKQASVNDRGIRWLSYLILLVLAALVIMWWRSHQTLGLQTDELGNAQDVTAAQTQTASDAIAANNALNHAQAQAAAQPENIPPISGFEAGFNEQTNPQIAQKMMDDDKQLNSDRLTEGAQSIVATNPAPKKQTPKKVDQPENTPAQQPGLASTRNLSLLEEGTDQTYPPIVNLDNKLHMNGFGNE